MSSTSNDYAPAWEPGDELPKWAAKLQEPFNPAEVGLRPQVWCPKCRDPQTGGKTRCCGMKAEERGSGGVEHVRKKCGDCGQSMTQAHMHLSYVGHAHITERLIQTDPRWTWRPMGRDIPDEVMAAAIATGDHLMVQAVISAYPPKIIEIPGPNGRVEHVLWGEVIVHDENGDEVVMPGVGDAIGKNWDPNAVKEMLGDLLRNAMMRHGTGLDMWKKEDSDRAKRERHGAGGSPDDPWGAGARAALFDDDAKPAQQQGRRRAPAERKPPEDTGGNEAGINPQAQAAADLAWKLAEASPAEVAGALEKLKELHTKTMKDKLLPLHCMDPGSLMPSKVKVFEVFGRAKRKLEGLPVPGDSQG